jgi:hypothetical protein
MDDTLIYSDFPVVGRTTADSFFDKPLPNTIEEISFSGQRQEYCVCFIDMVNSTTTTSNLNNVQICRYYPYFSMSLQIYLQRPEYMSMYINSFHEIFPLQIGLN